MVIDVPAPQVEVADIPAPRMEVADIPAPRVEVIDVPASRIPVVDIPNRHPCIAGTSRRRLPRHSSSTNPWQLHTSYPGYVASDIPNRSCAP